MKNYIVKFKCDSGYIDAQEWEDVYLDGNRINYKIYQDPDNSSKELYEDITKFLNIQENKVKELKGKFKYELSLDPLGIKVCEKNESNSQLLFILRSDQLGFSAPSVEKNHIYDFYLDKSENKEQARKSISKWIFNLRSIGGCFLWPMKWNEKIKRWQLTYYNVQRGMYQMQDRVDVTLQDIKNCFETMITPQMYKRIPKLYDRYTKEKNMQLWLNHFGSGKDGFLRYVEFFCFKDFLNDNGMPKDLLDGGEINFWNPKYVKKFSEYAVEDLEKILNNLNKCVLSRSEAIEKILKITVVEEDNYFGCKKLV